MKFTATPLAGVYVIDVDRREDERGFFARTWCEHEFTAQGLSARIVQINTGVSIRAGTLRGLHYQLPPHAEVKIARCVRGAVFDVVVDLRADSPTYCQWFGIELSAHRCNMLYVPEGCAHGYLTLCDDVELVYSTSQPYAPEAARGVRFDDPRFKIRWPREVTVISAQDRQWPDYLA